MMMIRRRRLIISSETKFANFRLSIVGILLIASIILDLLEVLTIPDSWEKKRKSEVLFVFLLAISLAMRFSSPSRVSMKDGKCFSQASTGIETRRSYFGDAVCLRQQRETSQLPDSNTALPVRGSATIGRSYEFSRVSSYQSVSCFGRWSTDVATFLSALSHTSPLKALSFLLSAVLEGSESKALFFSGKFGGWHTRQGQLARLSFGFPKMKSKISPCSLAMNFLWIIALGISPVLVSTSKAMDLRSNIMERKESCFDYTAEENLFRMNCSLLEWGKENYGPDTYISLSVNETFDGSGGSSSKSDEKPTIDLSEITDFKGLFEVHDNVTSFAEAPLIKNVHVRKGTITPNGGFIVRAQQNFFKVDSCSSTGDIGKMNAGGICGVQWNTDHGEIIISNSYSTGNIGGLWAGGIAGQYGGYNGGIVNITRCHSTGNIQGRGAGGICGNSLGHKDGTVYISQSYSTGDILPSALYGGGIIGNDAGHTRGYIDIQECYSIGQVSADYSGGITGSEVAQKQGHVHIRNCYTRGNIEGDKAGGITGENAGGPCANLHGTGTVYISNSYASGNVTLGQGGGIIGSICGGFTGDIHVNYSVYNAPNIVGHGPGDHLNGSITTTTTTVGNSKHLDDIRCQMYHHKGVQRWDDDTWAINGTDELPILRFQLAGFATVNPSCPSKTPSPSPSATFTASYSSTLTTSPSSSRTATSSITPTVTGTARVTPTTTGTPAVTPFPSDLRDSIIAGNEPCFEYISAKNLFQTTCGVLNWRAQWYGPDTHISLGANEVFDGNGSKGNSDEESIIDLSGIAEFKGMFRMLSDVTSLAEAPVIRNVHMKNGTVAKKGGFIVRESQTHFIVDSCSSTGDIEYDYAGGICGWRSGSHYGAIMIFDSHSTGRINGIHAGGITGQSLGYNRGVANITRCYSTGDIQGKSAGGICGSYSGFDDGAVNIAHSYSTGDILASAREGGGITGTKTGYTRGYANIEKCFSTGEISADYSGGITGSDAARYWGEVNIINSYTTGKIIGRQAGGIAGDNLARNDGNVNITLCHSTGDVAGSLAGGICGNGAGFEHGTVHIKQSYSTGDIRPSALDSGGIVGSNSGHTKGAVYIEECFSTGNMFASSSGGITGEDVAAGDGNVFISNCYSRGDIEGNRAGGITGDDTGGECCTDDTGTLYITNSYASGVVNHNPAGGMIGSISNGFTGSIHVNYSVYNALDIVGNDPGDHLNRSRTTMMGNSNNLDDIRGELYRYNGIQRWDDDTWVTNGTDQLPILRFQLRGHGTAPLPTISPSPSSSKRGKRLSPRRVLPMQRPPRSVRIKVGGSKEKRHNAKEETR